MKLTIAIFVAVLCGLLSLSAHGSVFYKFQIIAHTGQAGLTGIGSGVSINDKGTVAFVGTLAGGDNIFTGNGSLLKKVRSVESPAVTFGQNVQISNTGQIVARDTVAATSVSPVRTRVRIWDSNTTDANTIIARGSLGEDFDATIANALSINNKDLVVFAARTGVNNFLVTHPSTGGFLRSNPLTIPLRPALADDGRIVVRGGAAATDPILLYEYHLSSVGAEVVAQVPGSFTSLGRSPGISDDGSVVAFAGDRGNGPGVFVRLLESGGLGKGFIVAGEPLVPSAEIGYDNTSPPSPINITSVDFDQRVGVARVELGAPGFEDDVLYVTFVGTPSGASRDNPQLPGVPLVFSAGKGVWTIRIDLDAPLDGSGGFAIHLNSPLPVVQVGDRIPTMSGVCQVSDLAIYDPVAVAAYDDDGAVIRTQRRGDHRVAFWASCASGGAVVVRASHLDSDQDGLLDHWEEAGGGIDVDQDGIIDLDLSAFGATPGARDLFLELDWLSPRVTGSVLPYLLEPPPGSTQFLANMFAAAPALIGPRYGNRSDGLPPDDIPLGITAHIDAGTKTDALGHPFSQNIPPGSPALGGGDTITSGSSHDHIDLVYVRPSVMVVPGVRAHSLHEIKERFFGNADRRAREFAFRYGLLSDFNTMLGDRNGDGVVNGEEGNDMVPLIGTVVAAYNESSPLSGTTPVGSLIASGAPFDIDTKKGQLNGSMVMITDGPGAGQVRKIVGTSPSVLEVEGNWATLPDAKSHFVLLSGKVLGVAEVDYRSDFSSRPGNDFVVTFGPKKVTVGPPNFPGSPLEHGLTMAHELGHTFGLRHGGGDLDLTNSKTNYYSLMSYAYSAGTPNPITGLTVRDYSRDHLVFLDWENLRFDAFNSLHLIGNSFNLSAALGAIDMVPQTEHSEFQIERDFGPLDRTLPTVFIDLPSPGASVPVGSALTVDLTASDDTGIEAVTIAFDLDGDGTITDATEVIPATVVAGTKYRATLPSSVSGPDGSRAVRVIAYDRYLHARVVDVAVNVTSAAIITVPMVVGLTQAAATAALESAGLVLGTVTSQNSSTVGAGLVITQQPAPASQVKLGALVNITISSGPSVLRGDINGDGIVDQKDLDIILAGRNTIVASGDPRDLDGDGKVTALDARLLTTLCTRPRCATK